MAERASAGISYMGTKHELADGVARVIAQCKSGVLMDAFAGMGAVAAAHVDKRNVWTNDVQHFAHLASSCKFASISEPRSSRELRSLAAPFYSRNLAHLRAQNSSGWVATERLATAESFEAFERSFKAVSAETLSYENAYGCFLSLYANSYFSLIQCAQIDSIRCALESLRGQGVLNSAEFDWALLALGRASLRTANTTGHFAQFLTPNSRNYRRIMGQFRRCIFEEWLNSAAMLKPFGTSQWRKGNWASRGDSVQLLAEQQFSLKPSVVYCDPPYTDDQYSRFYHLWETLVLYDYPITSGKGRYRPERFVTDFSLKTRVAQAFRKLVRSIAAIEADLVVSYPSNGLLQEAGFCPLEIVQEVYPRAHLAVALPHRHSTMGASKGHARSSVVEQLILAKL